MTGHSSSPTADEGHVVEARFSPVLWSELRFSAQKFFLTASTTLRATSTPVASLVGVIRVPPQGSVVPFPHADALTLTMESTLPFGRREITTLWLDPATGAALQGDKLMLGRDPYRKVFRYTTRGLYIWRSSPSSSAQVGGDPDSWTRCKEYLVEAAAAPPDGAVITDSYGLFYLASAARLDRQKDPLRLYLLSDDRLVELTFAAEGLVQKTAIFEESWPGGSRHRTGRLLARRVRVTGRPFDAARPTSDVDLGFLGMRGELIILVEVGTGIPVEISGHSERIGELTVRLVAAVLHEPPATSTPFGD